MILSQWSCLRNGVVGFACFKGFPATEYDIQTLRKGKGSFGGDKLDKSVANLRIDGYNEPRQIHRGWFVVQSDQSA